MAFVQIKDGAIVGVFSMPQPHLDGYAEISDDDPKIEEFFSSLELFLENGN